MNEILGRVYQPGQDIIREGEAGDCMYVIQEGEVEVLRLVDDVETAVDSMGAGDIFGEIAIVERTVRTSTVRAVTEVRAITVDRETEVIEFKEHYGIGIRMPLTTLIEIIEPMIEEEKRKKEAKDAG